MLSPPAMSMSSVTSDVRPGTINGSGHSTYSTRGRRNGRTASRTAAIETLTRLVAPMAPHVAEEAWAGAGREGLIADAPWPEADPALLVEDEVTIAVQVNGKLRDTLTAQKGAGKDALEAMALSSEKIVRHLDGAAPKKVIVVPDRLVNIVA